jgi:hypothetical protein
MNRQLIGNKGGSKILKLFLMQNEIEFKDSVFDFGQNTFEGEFYNVARKDFMEDVPEVDLVNVYKTVYMLQRLGARHERSVYGFLAMIGDLGGVTEIIMLLFGFFLFPIAEFSFNIKAMKKWFLLATTDDNLVEKKCSENKVIVDDIDLPKMQKREISKHKKIKISTEDQIKLYLSRVFSSCFHA